MSEEIKTKVKRRSQHMRIVIPTLIAMAVLAIWFFKRPEIPEDINKALSQPVAEQKPEIQITPAPTVTQPPEPVPQAEASPAPQAKDSEDKVVAKNSSATVSKRVLGKVTGVIHQGGKGKGNGEWEISDHPPALRPIPSSEFLFAERAEKKKRDEEKARVVAVRDVQAANDRYFKILEEGR